MGGVGKPPPTPPPTPTPTTTPTNTPMPTHAPAPSTQPTSTTTQGECVVVLDHPEGSPQPHDSTATMWCAILIPNFDRPVPEARNATGGQFPMPKFEDILLVPFTRLREWLVDGEYPSQARPRVVRPHEQLRNSDFISEITDSAVWVSAMLVYACT